MNENNIEKVVDTKEAKIEEIKTKFGKKFGRFITTGIAAAALATGGALAQDQPVKDTQEITCPTPDESIENIAASLKIPQKDGEPICLNVVFGLPENFKGDKEYGTLLRLRSGNTLYFGTAYKNIIEEEDASLGVLLWVFVSLDSLKTSHSETRKDMNFDLLVDWVSTKTKEERILILHSLGLSGLLKEDVEVITDLNVLMPEELQ